MKHGVNVEEVNDVVARAFGHEPKAMLDDTATHLDEADDVALHRSATGELLAVAMYRHLDLLGKQALELAGRCVVPEAQAHGIGSMLLAQALIEHQPELVVTYTRNPGVLGMMERAGIEPIYPLAADEGLYKYALAMPHAEAGEDAVVHPNRYGSDGLYGVGYEVADMSDRFTDLNEIGNALVVVGRYE